MTSLFGQDAMPLIAWVYLSVASGLLAGFLATNTAVPLCLPLLVLAAAAQRLPRVLACACATLTLAAGLVGRTTPLPRRAFSMAPSGWLGMQYRRAEQAIAVVFRADAPMANALLIANQHDIPRAMKDRYASAGIIHMLSISGLHVAIVAGAVELLCQVARLSIRTAKLVALITLFAYVALIGFPPPAVRSGVMLAVSTLSLLLQRPTSRWAVLALGAILPLVKPATMLDLGYQLSVAGMAALIASAKLANRWRLDTLEGWRQPLARGLLASCVATLVTAPLVAWTFGRLSLIAPLANLVADPILAVAQPMLFAGLVLAPVLPLAHLFADAVHPLLIAFDTLATYAARVPYAAVNVDPTPLAAALAGLASTAMVIACASRFPTRPALVAASAFCLLIWIG